MGLLDYADAARKKLAGLLGDMPLVQMMQGRTEAPTQAGLLGALKGMPVFSPDAGQSAYEAALNIGPMGLAKIVWHGSPHKFDKFDASKIGTGEGAQAYGHGVYLADRQGVAEGYAKNVKPDLVNLDSKKAGELLFDELSSRGIAPQISRGKFGRDFAAKRIQWLEFPQDVKDAVRGKIAGDGQNLYKADLPDEWIPKMLDWDKPLREQPENVRLLAQDLGLAKDATGKDVYSALSNQARDMGIIKGQNAQTTLPGSQGRAATDLSEFGIPGIRYLDGGSRPNGGRISMLEQTIANLKGKGASQAAIANTQRELDAELARASYNYVVFPGLEDQVKILQRNGIPLTGLLGGQ